jgi:hypothetical protein
LLPMMVSLLSSRPPSLVGFFRCPPPPTLAASHGRRYQQSVTLTAGALTSPSSSLGPPVAIATPPAVLPLCGVVRTLSAWLAVRWATIKKCLRLLLYAKWRRMGITV